jgi:dienelactone hydrolase
VNPHSAPSPLLERLPASGQRLALGNNGRMSPMRHPSAAHALVALGVVALAACQYRPVADPLMASPTFRVGVRLSDLAAARPRTADLWVSTPSRANAQPLVLHLTGDGGAHGLDLQLFTALTRWGYPVALLSSRDWASSLVAGQTSPEALARDLDRLARAAAKAVGRPEPEPFVLLGLSRGAGLAVEAAAEEPLRGRVRGVVALGLCGKEEYVRRGNGSGRPYKDMAALGPLPLEVLQSTHDRYLSAREAREAFGPDTSSRALHAIEAQSHTFVDGREALLEQLERSLARVAKNGRDDAATPVSAFVRTR